MKLGQRVPILAFGDTCGSRLQSHLSWPLVETQRRICDVQKLLGRRKVVATFYCCQTHLVAILVSRLEWQSDSRM